RRPSDLSSFIAEDAPEDSAEQHSEHLGIQKIDTDREKLIVRDADVAKARRADDAEEKDVEDVDEVTEGRDRDEKGDGFSEGRRLVLGHPALEAYVQYRSDREETAGVEIDQSDLQPVEGVALVNEPDLETGDVARDVVDADLQAADIRVL